MSDKDEGIEAHYDPFPGVSARRVIVVHANAQAAVIIVFCPF
jgi:hypothetical protein